MVAMKQTDLCMAEVLGTYDKLVEGSMCSTTFWDIVVLTTSDAAQQRVYELEIDNKLKQKELPSCAKYYVVHDPPGPKIGSGGSTMYTLSKIVQLEPEWKSKKILLMHAGGSSQRLPSASVLGKAFTAIPVGDKVYTMFDIKLALHMPFAKRLPAGVFICCPDTFETFTFGNCEDLTFNDCKGFLALAHPSPISVGEGHGVYILEDRDSTKDTELLSCRKVLQKPSERQMREEGALINAHELKRYVGQSAASIDEYVFTDSNFFFDHRISEKLLKFYEENAPITDEICAYGDFLQPLGSNPNACYIKNCKNVMVVSGDLMDTRRKVYDLLHGEELNVLALKRSKFYHIGTLGEYVESFCESRDLQSELGLSRFCFSTFVGGDSADVSDDIGGCCLHSIISEHSSFADRSVVEFCKFDAGAVSVQDNCIVSNCVYGGSTPITVPQNTFMQTVPVFDPSGNQMYATLLFSVKDDLKAKVSSFKEAHNLSFFQRSLLSARPGVTSEQLFGEGNPYTLWNAKLFPLSTSAQSSFLLALAYVNKLISSKKRARIPEQASQAAELVSNGHDNSVTDTNSHSTSLKASSCNGNGNHLNGNSSSHGDHLENGNDYEINGNKDGAVLYSFADVIKFKDAGRMIEERNVLSSLIKQSLAS